MKGSLHHMTESARSRAAESLVDVHARKQHEGVAVLEEYESGMRKCAVIWHDPSRCVYYCFVEGDLVAAESRHAIWYEARSHYQWLKTKRKNESA